eukprot:COSAG05_NODE_953_length_6443_cov_14.987390_2_plen_120_part_00
MHCCVQLLVEKVPEELAVRYIDRYLMYYLLTADKLQRTARWLEKMEGGIEHLKDVILHDKLGICDELEQVCFSGTEPECKWVVLMPVCHSGWPSLWTHTNANGKLCWTTRTASSTSSNL